MNILDRSLGDIAQSIPGALYVFNQHHLDFNSGELTLRQAATEKEIDADAIAEALTRLSAMPAEAAHMVDAADDALIEYILTRYHDTHRQQFPELIRLAARVELVHGGHIDCPAGLTQALEQMHQDLEEHMRKEEQILFPMITRGMGQMAVQPVRMMRLEHEGHDKALAELYRITRDITLPEHACNTWRALYVGLKNLTQDLRDHIHMENNILFDRIDNSHAYGV
jgi:regulator of cell morphogenesis and NO signaling